MATRVDLFPPRWIAEFEKLQAEVPRGAVRGAAARARARARPLAVRGVPRPRHARARRGVDRAGAPREAAGRHAGGAQGPPARRAREDRRRPAPAAARRRADRVGDARGAALPARPRSRRSSRASLERELDFATETRNIERFAKNFAGDPYVVIPQLYPEWTSDVAAGAGARRRHSRPPTRRRSTRPASTARLLAARGVDAFLKMILIDGFFHADPHPGNVFYLPGNRIVIIDFGMVGRLSPQRRAQVIDLLAGLARMEEEPMLDVLLDWAGDAYVDEAKLAADVNELVFDYEGVPLKDIRIGDAHPPVRRHRARALDRAALRPVADVQGADHAGGPGAPVRPRLPHHRPPARRWCAARSPSATSPTSSCAAGAAR